MSRKSEVVRAGSNDSFIGEISEAPQVLAVTWGPVFTAVNTLRYGDLPLNLIAENSAVAIAAGLAGYTHNRIANLNKEGKKRHRIAASLTALGLGLASFGMLVSAKQAVFPDYEENSFDYAPAVDYPIGPINAQADDILIGAGLTLSATGAAAYAMRRKEDEEINSASPKR